MMRSLQTGAMYLGCVAIWGTSYFAYNAFQAPHGPVELSLVLRLVFAALLFWIFSAKSRPLVFLDHVCLAAFGLSNFTLAYSLLYVATDYLVSAWVIIVFSTKSLWT